MDLSEASSALVEAGARLSAERLSPGTTGNLSIRVEEGLLCTGTGAELGALSQADLSLLSLDGVLRDGPNPTKEVPMHLAMYAAAPSVAAVVHTHARHATAYGCLAGLDPHDAVRAMTPYLTMKLGRIGVVAYRPPGDAGLRPLIENAVAEGHRGLLLANHGTLVGDRSLAEAVSATVELEEATALSMLLHGRSVRYLTPGQVDELVARG
ncbi:class II aldolase/adducin family protein [Nocardioides acrostichi]|uniref:Class II aldolase/adducin family protein n=1 Tax=Nocardioides acrostichi TaxID=2784339 RepID=A0A930UZ43_9ACTN|nr:class II aldolase/adducin family protein [Nocardioides acrostichi]MBF4160772.1 class II aldolase/adducin family protein [Nocardioides acrostichi]